MHCGMLTEVGLIDYKPSDTLMVVNHKLQLTERASVANREHYQRLVGKLIYLSHTRPNIAYAVRVVSQFMHQPQEKHIEAAIRIVRYLKGKPEIGIMFEKHRHLDVEVYNDADWAGNLNDRRSIQGTLP